MKKMTLCLFAFLFFTTPLFAEERGVDFEIKSGLEIIGAKESPRVIFFLPPLELKVWKNPVKNVYFIDKSLIEEDIKGLILEEVKDASNIR